MSAMTSPTLLRILFLNIALLLVSHSAFAIDKTVSVIINGGTATVTIYPDTFSAENFADILTISSRQEGTRWVATQLTSTADGTKSATLAGYGHHEVRFIRRINFAISKIVQIANVYIPFPLSTNAEALARQYAPISVFNNNEQVMPVPLEDIFSNNRFFGQFVETVTVVGDGGKDMEIEVPLERLNEYMANNIGRNNRVLAGFKEQTCDSLFPTSICEPHPLRSVSGDENNITLYWHLSRENSRDYLSYHYFYAFDYKDGSLRDPAIAAHALDRESFTIEFDISSGVHVPLAITYGAHLSNQVMLYSGYERPDPDSNIQAEWEGGRTKLSWANAITSGKHPVVYMARGSHGIFPAQGWYRVTQKIIYETVNVRELASLDEEAGSRDNSLAVFPTNSSLTLKELPLSQSSVLNFSGHPVDLMKGTATFPPFADRLPSSNWVTFSDNFAQSCPAANDGNQCTNISQYIAKPYGLKDWRAIEVNVTNQQVGDTAQRPIIELREINQRDNLVVMASQTIDANGRTEFFIKSNSDYYGLYVDDRVCGEFSASDAGFQENVNYLQSFSAACVVAPEVIEEPEPSVIDLDPVVEPDPVIDNDTNLDPAVRNSLAWYPENQNERLRSEECLLRPGVFSLGDEPVAWSDIYNSFSGTGSVAGGTPMASSITGCINLLTWLNAGNSLQASLDLVDCRPNALFSDSICAGEAAGSLDVDQDAPLASVPVSTALPAPMPIPETGPASGLVPRSSSSVSVIGEICERWTGRTIAGSTITAAVTRDDNGNVSPAIDFATTTADANGDYSFVALPDFDYRFNVVSDGFVFGSASRFNRVDVDGGRVVYVETFPEPEIAYPDGWEDFDGCS